MVGTQRRSGTTGRRKRRGARRLALAVAVVVLLGVAVLAGGGWYFADQIRATALAVEPPDGGAGYDIPVLAVDDHSITLATGQDTPAELLGAGRWGLEWPDGDGQVDAVTATPDGQVVRQFRLLRGRPLRPGDRVRLDVHGFPDDPLRAFGIPFWTVSYRSPLGEFPAWFVPGRSRTWAIMVHGKGAPRSEALRMLPALFEAGLPALVISYRNDPGTPADPSGYYRFGQTEWRDLDGAVRYALDHGADDVVLAGFSMGGGIAAAFMERSPLAGHVRGAILDSPALDLGAMVDHGAAARRIPGLDLPIPGVLTWAAKRIAGVRFGIDWDRVDHLRLADRLAAPILLFQGTADDKVPVATSDTLAERRADLVVTYERVDGAGHVRAWNLMPERYERDVREFLAGLPAGAAP
jgi:alpha-beta hydrolase superfamily lysophospholipase